MVKNLSADAGDAGSTLDQEDSLEKEMTSEFSIFLVKSQRQRRLVGYASRDCKELDTTYHQNNNKSN